MSTLAEEIESLTADLRVLPGVGPLIARRVATEVVNLGYHRAELDVDAAVERATMAIARSRAYLSGVAFRNPPPDGWDRYVRALARAAALAALGITE